MVIRCVLGIQSRVGASMSKSTPRDIAKYPVARWAPLL